MANGNLILQSQMPTLGLCLRPVLSQTGLQCQVIGICSHSTTVGVGESWGGKGRLGSDKALVTQAASCPWLFFRCPARLLPHCPTPTPSSPKLLIPDSCNDCRHKWGGRVCHQPAAVQATPTT